MKKNMLWTGISLAIMVSTILAGCTIGTGTTGTQSRDVSGFKHIAINTFGEMIIQQGDEESLTIQAPSDHLRYIETDVTGDTLNIKTRRGYVGIPTHSVTYTLTVKDLNEISFSGAGSIKVYALETDALKLNLSGAGSIEIDSLTADNLEVNLSAAGAITIAGKVKNEAVTISGVGGYESGDLESHTASVVMSGAGSAVLWVTDNLDVTISGVGSVSYFGSPSVSQNISGLGSVKSKGEHH